ncbi:hypothetical protein MMPV_000587 [Pyropia vietnamensis]
MSGPPATLTGAAPAHEPTMRAQPPPPWVTCVAVPSVQSTAWPAATAAAAEVGVATSCPMPSLLCPAAGLAAPGSAAVAPPPAMDMVRSDAGVVTGATPGSGLRLPLAALMAPAPTLAFPSVSLPTTPIGGGGARRGAVPGGKRSRSRPVPVLSGGRGSGDDGTPPSSPLLSPRSPRGVAASALSCLIEEEEDAARFAAPLWPASPASSSLGGCSPVLAAAAAVAPGGGVGGGDRPFMLGIAALRRKLRHPLMRAFLSALSEALPSGRWVYLPVEADDVAGGGGGGGGDARSPPPVADWPDVDVLLAFHSPGFPLSAVSEYAAARQVPLVNSLADQVTLRDRSEIWAALVEAGVPTPDLVVRRESAVPTTTTAPGAAASASADTVHGNVAPCSGVVTQDGEWLLVDGIRVLRKPFVEKPLDADDHLCIVYHAGDGGASIIERKRVTHMPDRRAIRPTGSYVYERYHRAVAGADVKVYAAGGDAFFAETRTRTPAGVVVRAATALSALELAVARRVAATFGQFLTGFDIIRATDGRVLVIDVNGWSIGKAESGAFIKVAVSALAQRLRATLTGGSAAAFAPPPRLAGGRRLPRLPRLSGGGDSGGDSGGGGEGKDFCGPWWSPSLAAIAARVVRG